MAKALSELLEEGVAGRHVLVRSDLNVPLKDGVVTDDGRVRASLPVIEKLAKAGARVIVTAHLGRPKGKVDPQYSIAPAAARLAELASVPVKVATDLVGEDAKAKAWPTARSWFSRTSATTHARPPRTTQSAANSPTSWSH